MVRAVFRGKKERFTMLERMEDFFARRVEEYDEHMLHEVEGCEEGYRHAYAKDENGNLVGHEDQPIRKPQD